MVLAVLAFTTRPAHASDCIDLAKATYEVTGDAARYRSDLADCKLERDMEAVREARRRTRTPSREQTCEVTRISPNTSRVVCK